MSYYGYDHICSTLEVDLDRFLEARNALLAKDLIATDGTRVQVLSLPDQPVTCMRGELVTKEDFERTDPATIRQLFRNALGED